MANTNATTANGGVNDNNQQKYLQSLFNSGGSGDKSWAFGEAQKSGVNLDTSGYKNYLQNLYNTGNSGERSWAKAQNGQYGVNIVTTPDAPASYATLSNPGQLQDYAHNQALTQYQNEDLGYKQQQQLYNQQKSQLLTDQAINDKAKQLASLKYADALLQTDAQKRNADAEYQNNVESQKQQAEGSKKDIYTLAFQQRQRAKEDLNSRGLYDSTFLDNRLGGIDQSQMAQVGSVVTSLGNNIAQLDRGISAMRANLDAQKTSLTQRQAQEAASAIADMTKERDDKSSYFDTLVSQLQEKRGQSLNNMSANEANTYNQLYGQYAGLYRQDRAFEEQKRQAAADAAARAASLQFQKEQATQSQKNWEAEMGLKSAKELAALADSRFDGTTQGGALYDALKTQLGDNFTYASEQDLRDKIPGIADAVGYKLTPSELQNAYNYVLTRRGNDREKVAEANSYLDPSTGKPRESANILSNPYTQALIGGAVNAAGGGLPYSLYDNISSRLKNK